MHKQRKTDQNSLLPFSDIFLSEKKKKDAKEEFDAKLVQLLWKGVVEVVIVGCCCCFCWLMRH